VDNVDAACQSDIVVIAVRPSDLASTLAPLRPHWRSDQIVVSVVAALTLPWLRSHLGPLPALCRWMPAPSLASVRAPLPASREPGSDATRLEPAARLGRSLARELIWTSDDQLDLLMVTVGAVTTHLSALLGELLLWGEAHGLDPAALDRMLTSAVAASGEQFAADGSVATALRHATTPGGMTDASMLALQSSGALKALSQGAEAMLERVRALRGAL
jgi:pyrroline-5-carboxylate reductase